MTEKKTHNRGAVRCIDTGILYASAAAACRAISCTRCGMSNHLAGRAPHIRGLRFERVNQAKSTT